MKVGAVEPATRPGACDVAVREGMRAGVPAARPCGLRSGGGGGELRTGAGAAQTTVAAAAREVDEVEGDRYTGICGETKTIFFLGHGFG